MEHILFEIPVYIMNEEEYYKNWEFKKTQIKEKYLSNGYNDEAEFENFFMREYKYNFLWDYNKIVAFIRITYVQSFNELRYDLFVQNKRVSYNEINKMKFHQINGPNLRVPISNKSNEDLLEDIVLELQYIKKVFFNNRFVDDRAFANIIYDINVKKIVENINK